jgi:hypothetical protein
MQGRIAIVTDAGRNAVDAGGALTNALVLRTAKSCGPDASMVGVKSVMMLRITPATVTKKPDHRGARRKPLKPSRAGMPGDPVQPW